MEQKKVLLVLLSVALFLVVVLALGLYWFYPRPDEDETPLSEVEDTEQEAGFDPVQYVRESEEPIGLDEPPTEAEEEHEEDMFIVYGDAEAGAAAKSGAEPAAMEDTETPAIGPQTTEMEAARTSPGVDTAVTSQSEERSLYGPEDMDSPRASRATAEREGLYGPEDTASSSAGEDDDARTSWGTVSPTTKWVTEYWIQPISSPQRDTVEQVKEEFVDYGLRGKISTATVEGRLYYRFRVGPFTDKEEAAKFLDWIRKVDAYKDSYISAEYRKKIVRR